MNLDPPGERLVQIVFPARPDRLRLARHALADAADLVGASEVFINDLVLAVDEACQNIIRHAYGGPTDRPIEMDVRKNGGSLVVRLVDYAPPVDPSRIKPRALEDVRPGGLGTHFIQALVDERAFLAPPPGAGNLLQLVKRFA
ncbi:MAG: ATP-binding protein [Rhodospirillales bacterium]|nr:ATP-binding protein [Rhodospirillales bacterium]